MVKMIAVWLLLSVVIGGVIAAYGVANKKERWQLTKTVIYATMCSLVAVIILSAMVVVF